MGIILNFKYEINRHFAISYFDWKFKKARKKNETASMQFRFNFSKTN